MRKQFLKIAAILLCTLCLLAGREQSAVFAKEEKAQGPFTGEVAVVRQENNGYVVQVTVSNSGEDFTGTVQVVFAGADSENCAYNTEIALPAQGKKQFTIRVANTAVDTSQGGMCALRFLDREGDVLQAIELKNVFQKCRNGSCGGNFIRPLCRARDDGGKRANDRYESGILPCEADGIKQR